MNLKHTKKQTNKQTKKLYWLGQKLPLSIFFKTQVCYILTPASMLIADDTVRKKFCISLILGVL